MVCAFCGKPVKSGEGAVYMGKPVHKRCYAPIEKAPVERMEPIVPREFR